MSPNEAFHHFRRTTGKFENDEGMREMFLIQLEEERARNDYVRTTYF